MATSFQNAIGILLSRQTSVQNYIIRGTRNYFENDILKTTIKWDVTTSNPSLCGGLTEMLKLELGIADIVTNSKVVADLDNGVSLDCQTVITIPVNKLNVLPHNEYSIFKDMFRFAMCNGIPDNILLDLLRDWRNTDNRENYIHKYSQVSTDVLNSVLDVWTERYSHVR